MIILMVLMAAGCCYWLYWRAGANRLDSATASLPVPPSLPLLGNAMLFIGDAEKIVQNLDKIAELGYKHKGAAKLWLGPKLYIAIGNAEDAKIVLENCLDKDVVYRFLRPWLGHGLFVAPLGLWKSHRKVLLPVFHNKIVEEYLGVIGEQTNILIERLREQSNEDYFDVLRYITACTLDIVFETAMGERMDIQHSPDTPYLRARHTVMTILNMRFFKVWLQPDCLFNLTTYARQQKESINLTHEFTNEVVRKRRLEYERNKLKKSNEKSALVVISPSGNAAVIQVTAAAVHTTLCPLARVDNVISGIQCCQRQHDVITYMFLTIFTYYGKLRVVLDMLFGREIEFTDEQLREHIDSITIAGNDTTALVIAYTLVLLGIHQDAQEEVFKEQESIFDGSKRAATKEDIYKMHCLERVIKESMRLYSVVPIVARNIDRDLYLPYCGVTLPAGASAVVGVFAIHRSIAEWGPSANEFDPNRFLPENSIDRHPAAFMPFSYGPRNCIGRNFGMILAKSIISSIVRSYKIDAKTIGRLKMELLLFPIDGHQIRIRRR